MPNLFDWIDALSKPPDNPALKDLDRWKQIDESLKRGDYISKINIEDSPLSHIEQTVKAISEKLEIEHSLHIEDRKDAERQKIIERNRFIITYLS